MEIRTTKLPNEFESPETGPPPERSRYLRRKPTQRLRRSVALSGRLLAIAAVIGKFLFLIALAALIFAVFNYAYSSEKFRLQRVTIMGAHRVDAGALEQAILQSVPSNILMIELREVRVRLERETWIKRAELRRVLPSELLVYIEERVPAVVLELKGELFLADDEGVLLDRYHPKYGRLDVPVFRGLAGDGPESFRLYQEQNALRVRLARRMLDELDAGSPAFSRSISEVDLADKSNVRVLLVDDTVEILLGDRDFLKRFQTLMSNLDQYQKLKTQYTEIASIDLRFDGQIIYRPRPNAGPAGGAQPPMEKIEKTEKSESTTQTEGR